MITITIEAHISPTPELYAGKPGWRAWMLVNGKVIQPYPNFRKTERGARALANNCAREREREEKYFGNEVTVVEA